MDFGRFSDLTTDLRILKDHLAHKGQLSLFSSSVKTTGEGLTAFLVDSKYCSSDSLVKFWDQQ